MQIRKESPTLQLRKSRPICSPRLQARGVGVSQLGSPIGKVKIDDEEGFEKQCAQLETLCEIAKVLNCKYIRMFSFFMPEGKDPADYRDAVIEKLRKFIDHC